jgi:2-polyprenyl-6-methoxyphenol hydroxylase-like FAD-dependent oxidoreductase
VVDREHAGGSSRSASSGAADVRSVRRTACCVVGAGPAGAVLSLLLARAGVPVVLLETHADFDRDFRGDSLHPAIMRVLDEVGLADRLLELPHRKIRRATLPADPPLSIDFSRLPTRFPYIVLMPQAQFLEFVTSEAARNPAFTLLMRASARELLVEHGQVRGVRYQGRDGRHEVRAALTVGADGRSSRLRRLSRLPVKNYGSPIDVVWFRLPRVPADPEGVVGQVGAGRFVLMADRGDQWQLGMVIPKGSYPKFRAEGLGTVRSSVAAAAPWLGERTAALRDWNQIAVLSVQADLLRRWWRPGLLLIGDAAHAMSPVAGNGINYAIADAVAAANRLAAPLAHGHVSDRDLAAVQRRRFGPARLTQLGVAQIQDRVLARMGGTTVGPPAIARALLRSPIGGVALRLAAFGLRPEHVTIELRARPPDGANVSRPS